MNRMAFLMVCAVFLAGCAQYPRTDEAQMSPDGELDRAGAADEALAETWGVEIVGVWRSAGGYMLDFRYRVIDAEKAAPLLTRGPGIRPYLIDQASGAQLGLASSPKVGPLRQTTQVPTVGRVYFAIFANPGGMVASGNKVTVVIGDFRAEDLVVQY
ncbi:MAG: hypothetical protein JW889_09130 [Verrucomicrobia bacterium]|nr:hypothetical protein [Verrucomicrobiota bacterium]